MYPNTGTTQSTVVMKAGLGIRQTRCESAPHFSPAVWSWGGYLITLCLRFLILKMEMIKSYLIRPLRGKIRKYVKSPQHHIWHTVSSLSLSSHYDYGTVVWEKQRKAARSTFCFPQVTETTTKNIWKMNYKLDCKKYKHLF